MSASVQKQPNPAPSKDHRVTLLGDAVAATVTVAFHGEIDCSNADGIAGAASMARHARRSLVLDLSEVTFMDSQGINALVQASHRMTEHGGSLAIRSPSPAVRRVIGLLGLSEILELVD